MSERSGGNRAALEQGAIATEGGELKRVSTRGRAEGAEVERGKSLEPTSEELLGQRGRVGESKEIANKHRREKIDRRRNAIRIQVHRQPPCSDFHSPFLFSTVIANLRVGKSC